MSIDLSHRVVEPLEEAENLGLVGLAVPQAVGHDRSVALEVVLSSLQGPSVHLLVADSDEEHISRVDPGRGHHLGLEFGLREVLKHPAVLEAVSLLGSLGQ